jgi:hypothetical protein
VVEEVVVVAGAMVHGAWYCGRDLSIHIGVIIVLQNRLVIEQGSITQACNRQT